MMLNVGLDPDGTIYVNVIAHDETDHSWYSVSNISNAYAGDTSTTYAAINLTRGSEAETYVYFIFSPLSRIPANAYIYYIKCDINCYTNAGNNGPGTFILCEGTTEVSPSVAIGNSSANHKTITSTKWTRAQLDNIRLKVYNKRGTSQTSTAYYDRFYGATLTVQYAVEPEPYLTFEDSEVESVCADAYGDGTGTKQIQADLFTSTGLAFRENTDIVSFNEFGEYFTNVTTITAGSSTSALGGFGGCTALESITLPESLTTVGAYAFYGCTSLKTVDLSNVTSIGNYAFSNCYGLEYIVIPDTIESVSHTVLQYAAREGTIVIEGNLSKSSQSGTMQAKHLIVKGDVNQSNYYSIVSTRTETIRFLGDYNRTGSNGGILSNAGTNNNSSIMFFELMGVLSGSNAVFPANQTQYLAQGCIVHLGYSGVAIDSPATLVGSGTTVAKLSRVDKIYVGDGTSEAADQAVLDQYLAVNSWAAVSSKLDLWYNYDGEYKTPPTIPII